MTGALIKRGNLDTESHTGRMPCEDRGDTAEASNYDRVRNMTLYTFLLEY